MKLYADFFEQLRVKTLLKKPNGETYCVLLMRMMLKCLDCEYVYHYEGVFSTIEQEISEMFDVSEEIANEYVATLVELGFAMRRDDGLFFVDMCDMIGSECASAERVRRHRANNKSRDLLQCNGNVTNGNVEKIREDKSRVEERESNARVCARREVSSVREGTFPHGWYKNVYITEKEHTELIGEFGETCTNSTIERLSAYVEQMGDGYRNHYAVIREWAKEDSAKNGSSDNSLDIDSDENEYVEAALARAERYLRESKKAASNEEQPP